MTPDDGRLDASDQNRAVKQTRVSACLECGKSFSRPTRTADFCSTPCRKTWNNRRMTRGAELYDLLMAHRFQRPLAKTLGVLSLINRLASLFRERDHAEREGRLSWHPPTEILARRPYLRAQVLRTRGRRTHG
jgi:hypothetical protein